MTFVSYAQNFEDVMLWRALKHVDRGFYIDVGAFDPDIHSVTRAFYEADWRGINIEPLEAGHQRLIQKRLRDLNLGVAVGDRAGLLSFYTIPETGLSTLDAELAEIHARAGLDVGRAEVRITTLAAVCAEHAPDTIHFLKVDCEGSERAALAGADFTRYRPWIVVVEATLPNTQLPSYGAWEPILLEANYQFVWFDGLNRFYVALEQHASLAAAFSAPPNVFDVFVRPETFVVSRTRTDPESLEATTPSMRDQEARIAITARCRDADSIPKVPDAGMVRTLDDGSLVQVMHNGLLVAAGGYYGAWMERLIGLCRGHHEPQEERMFHEVVSRLPDSATMIELGGYWSYYTAWFLQGLEGGLQRNRQAVVLEPDPIHRAVGKRTLELNGLTASFVSGFAGASSASPAPFQTEKSGTLLLPRYSVADVMEAHGIEVLNLLHCDAQGAELEVLKGCRALLEAKRIQWLFVSTHAHPITGDPLTHQRCLALLRDLGAVVEAEHDVWESFSGDGLIVARFGAAPAGWEPVTLSYNRYGESLYRNPAYDLAEALAPGLDSPSMAKVVEAAYKTLLLRPVDGDGLRTHTRELVRSDDIEAFLNRVLTCDEFAGSLARFLAVYGHEPSAPKPPVAAPKMQGSAVRLMIEQDGALGFKGESVLLSGDHVITPYVLQHRSWNEAQVAFVAKQLIPNERYTLLDIGANIGLFSRQLLHACPQIVGGICVEPDGDNFALLKKNLTGFRGRSLHFHNLALDRVDGKRTLLRDRENSGNYSLNADAMRNRPHDKIQVWTAETAGWMSRQIGGMGPLVWKSDAQGHDAVIIGETPWEVWSQVQVAVIELWRLQDQVSDLDGFLARIDIFPHKMLGLDRPVTTGEVAAYLSGHDWAHDDLFLWH